MNLQRESPHLMRIIGKKIDLVSDSNFMEKIKVRCTSFSDFINSNNLDKLDLLLIDTEGYEYNILKGVNHEFPHNNRRPRKR